MAEKKQSRPDWGNRHYKASEYRGGMSSYNRVNYFPDNDENRDFRHRDYEDTPYGTSGTYGYRPDYNYNQNRREDLENYNYPVDEWNTNKASGAGLSGSDYGRPDHIRAREEDRYRRNVRRDQPRNIYGGDTANYGNASQGGFDRDLWRRTREEISSWFGRDKDDREREREDEVRGYKGKGPKDYRRSETSIMEDVCDRLYDDDRVDASNVEVKVEGDEVILEGTVHTRSEKRRAEDVAASVRGVHDVQNRLHIENK